MRRVWMLAAGLAAAGAAAAVDAPKPVPAPPWYSVEVLVFRYTGPGAAQGELWPATVSPPPLTNAVYPAAAATGAYAARPAASATMANAQGKLSAAGGYQRVAEIGWQQPGVNGATGRPVSLAPPAATAAAGAVFSETAPQTAAAAPPPPSALPAPVRLTGTATLIVADNKPHIALDLRLCEPPPSGIQIRVPAAATTPQAASAGVAASAAFPAAAQSAATPATTAAMPPSQCFALRQRRQVTPGQLEYFDNPAFGVLVLVTPLTPPATAAGAPPAANAPGRSRSPGWP